MIDNTGEKHHIELHKADGEIYAHHCDAYADDPDNRTEAENEHNNQARRFAKYHVFCERGYDTVEHTENPAYVNAVRLVIQDLSDAEFERYFGALRQQVRSHHEDVDRPVELPAGVRAPDAVVYELDVWLGIDVPGSGLEAQARALAEAHDLDYDAGTRVTNPSDISDSDLAEWEAFGDHVVDLANPDDLELDVAAVSGIHVGYPNAQGQHEVQRADRPLDRQPDATLELMPAEPGPLDEFRAYLDHHLRCQVRDCFVGMGLLPPEAFRVIGFGKFIYARRYDHYELYPQLHLRDGDHSVVLG
nr:hypothetical protein [Halovivax ruber]